MDAQEEAAAAAPVGALGLDRTLQGHCCGDLARIVTLGGTGFRALIDVIAARGNALKAEVYADTSSASARLDAPLGCAEL